MLDIKLIRENPDLIKENLKKRFKEDRIPLVDEVLEIDAEWRSYRFKADKLRSERNRLSEEVNKAKKLKDETKANKLISQSKKILLELGEIAEKEKELGERTRNILYKIPNILHESVPIGKDDSQNVEIERIGDPIVPNYEILNHAVLAENLLGADFDSARETSGAGFFFLMNQFAVLHSAMLSFARDYMIKEGFAYVIPPFMIRGRVVEGVMSFEEMNNMMYKIEGEDLYLIGTSEHSMIGRFIDKTLQKRDLPIKLTSYSPCFRKEIGAHGIEEKGFFRVHQFEKQEMIAICEPEDSYKLYDKMLKFTVDVFSKLNIPVRTLEICSGDLADLKSKSADIEAWSPRQKKYFEVGSCSNLTDAQARRLNIKVNSGNGNYFAHTLNNTVLASPRALIALLENNQQKDGSIKIPEVLWKYTGFKEIKKA